MNQFFARDICRFQSEMAPVDEHSTARERYAYFAYSLFRHCGLSAANSGDLLGSPVVKPQLEKLGEFFEAAQNEPVLKPFPERRPLYLALRLQGQDHETALNNSWGGPLWLRFMCEPDFESDLPLLYQETMIPLCAKSMPWVIEFGRTFEPLGAGKFNTVYLVELPDPENPQALKKYAFKPSSINSDIGWGAEVTGVDSDTLGKDQDGNTVVTEKNYHPEFRTMASYNALRALGLDGFVQKSFMGIVNGELGLLTEYVEGPVDPQTNSRKNPQPVGKHASLEVSDPKLTQYLNAAGLDELEDLERMLDCQIGNGPGGVWIVEGWASTADTTLWDIPEFRQLYADAAVLRQILNDQDGHPGNYIIGRDQQGKPIVILIDLDQALGPKLPNPFSIPEEYSLFTTIHESFISASLAQRFQPKQHEARFKDACRDLLTPGEVAANFVRICDMRERIDRKDIEIIHDPQQWMAPRFDDRSTTVLARHRLLVKERMDKFAATL